MTIRKISTEDAPKLIDFFRTLVAEDPERVETIEDAEKITLEKEVEWIDILNEKESKGEQFSVCLEEEGKIVAEGEVEKMKRKIDSHVAEIRFGILPKYKHLALGLVKYLENIAKESGVEILIYFHLSTQKIGLEIMKEAGYVECGAIEKYYKCRDEYIDRIYMTKRIGII